MAITTYNELKTAIANWLDRDDLTSRIDEFLDLAEARHARDIRLRQQLVETSGSTGTADRFMPLTDFDDISDEDDFLAAKRIHLDTSPITRLHFVGPEEILLHTQTAAGKPRYVTVHKRVEFDRKPDKDYTIELLFWKRLTALSASNTSNALLAQYPDAYLYGVLAEAGPFLKDERETAMFEALYQRAVNQIRVEENTSRWSQGPLATRPDILTP